MKEFQYTIKDACGIHARPAGLLVKVVKSHASTATIEKDGKSCDMRKLMALMGMGVKQGDTVTIKVEGDDEDAAAEAIQKFMTENLWEPSPDGLEKSRHAETFAATGRMQGAWARRLPAGCRRARQRLFAGGMEGVTGVFRVKPWALAVICGGFFEGEPPGPAPAGECGGERTRRYAGRHR